MTPAEIKAARKALGLTQRQLAEALDLSSSRVIRGWESGEYAPSRRSVRDLEQLLEEKEQEQCVS